MPNNSADLYDTDIVTWSEQQAALLHRLARGERVNNQVDWDNVIEEIEDVAQRQVDATLSQIDNILRHRVYLLGWPDSLSVRRWQAELDEFTRQLHRHYRPSMTTGRNPKVTDAMVRESYIAAVKYSLAHMDAPPAVPLPAHCPVTLDEMLAEPPDAPAVGKPP